jgi:diguanylate cyclase (GGDEF)-like protein/PAS domain S-box-containing protein
VDPEGQLLDGNTALAALAGVERIRLPGLPATELAHPVGRAAVWALLQEADAGEVRVQGRAQDSWLRLSLAAAPGSPTDDGVPIPPGFRLLTAIDISAEVRAERSLQVLSDNALDIVALTDTEGRVTWMSPSVRAVLGRDPATLQGQHLADLAAPEDLVGLNDALAGAEPGQVPAIRTVRMRSASGAFRYMSVTARPTDDPGTHARTAVAMRDITEELRAKRELARSEEQFRMALLGAPEGMAVTDSQDRIVQVNPALCELLGAPAPALIGHRFREYIPEEDRESVDQWRERLLRGTSIERCQHRLAGPSSEVWVDHSVGVMRDELGNPQLFVHQFADRTAARRLQADLAYRASHDVQTGLANKESLRTRLGQRLGAPPESPDVVGVLFCDIDNLKPINDRHGHLVGDTVISAVANRLERAVRRQDVVARVGGDEFVIVLEHCRSVEELAIVARNLHAAGSHPVETSAGTIEVSLSVGAVLAESTSDTDQALARADAALYRAKRGGRNRISVEGLPDA